MRIAFNGVGCGWGNNGGTQSIFRMAGALAKLGVDVELWSEIPNKFTWFEPEAKLRQTTLENAPEVDILINTGCNTTMSTYNYSRKKVGVQWLRGHEIWAQPEEKLHELYKLDMPIWGNSEWLVEMVNRTTHPYNAEVQYCGIPLDEFYKTADNTVFTIGALWSPRSLKRASIALEVAKKVGGVRLLMFGDKAGPPGIEYIKQPTMDQKRKMMSLCDIWLATSEMEGLHIPPMEAALCGATVVAPEHPSAGVSDYCINGLTGGTYNTVDEAVEQIEFLKKKPAVLRGMNGVMQRMIHTKIGDVETNAKRMIEKMEKLLE
jgi:hypothetical protein